MLIRPATHEDLENILNIYNRARIFMRENGNPDQWGDCYPQKELIIADLKEGRLRLLVDDESTIAGVFSLFADGDPDYDEINGAWLNEDPYVAVHRVASAGTHKGVFTHIFNYCLSLFPNINNIKIDTHPDNLIMQSILSKHGFIPCGTINIENMDFIVFQFVRS